MKCRIYKVVWNIALLCFVGLTYYLFGKYTGIYLPCLFHTITGLDCPGCGITRMIKALCEGNVYKAFRSNVAVFALIPFFVIELFWYIFKYIKGDKGKISKMHNALIYLVLISVIVFGILRNIPYFHYFKTIG